MAKSPLLTVAATGVAVALLAPLAPAQPAVWHIDPAASRLVVHVDAAGLFSPWLKDHHFTPDEWSARLRFDPEEPQEISAEVLVVADSLRNLQTELSPDDQETVARQVRSPDILDVERYPDIRFTADRLEIHEITRGEQTDLLTGTLRGDLTIRDRTEPVELAVTARWSSRWLRATARSSFTQTQFGIEPYRRFLGTVAVADRLRVEIEMEATVEPDSSPRDSTLR